MCGSAISTATASTDMLIGQNVPKVVGDAAVEISCLTAVTLDGKVLWQLGRPDPRNGLLTCDTPFQIHDLDGDGHADVVLAKDFKLQVLDGRTGKVKRSTELPKITGYPDVPQTAAAHAGRTSGPTATRSCSSISRAIRAGARSS